MPPDSFSLEHKFEVDSMIGWWIVVTLQTPQERKSATVGSNNFVVAQWETGLSGKDWISGMVRDGDLTEVDRGGYPDRYTVKARDILPLIAHGPAPYALSPTVVGNGRRIAKVNIVPDLIESCSPDQVLTVETWDLS